MVRSLTAATAVWLALVGATLAADPEQSAIDLQRQMLGLRQQAEDLAAAGESERAGELLRQMVALDREHPKVYAAARKLYVASRRWDEAEALMESFGSRGPGIDYGRGLLLLLYDIEEAERLMRRSQAQYEEIGHLGGQLACHGALGYLMQKQKQVDEAERHFRASRGFADRLMDREAAATSLAALALIEIGRGRQDQALALQQEALALCESLDDSACVARSWFDIGTTQQSMGRRTAALDAMGQALELRRRLGNLLGQITVLRSMADVHVDASEWAEAIELLERAHEMADGAVAETRLAELLYDLGRANNLAGETRRAVEVLRSALEIQSRTAGRSRSRRWHAAATRIELGNALTRTGEFSAAEQTLRDAVAEARATGSARLEAQALNWLAIVLWSRGEPAAALIAEERALELYREAGDDEQQVALLCNLGTLHFALGDRATARRHYELCLELARESGDASNTAHALNNLGLVLNREGDLQTALAYAREAVTLSEQLRNDRSTTSTRLYLADTLLALGRLPEAERVLKEALKACRRAGDPRQESWALNYKAELKRQQGRPKAALVAYGDALALSERYGMRDHAWAILAGRARLLEESGRLEEALQDDMRAMDALESLRPRFENRELSLHFTALGERYAVYEHALDLRVRLEGTDSALARATFEIAERTRARSLADLLAESRQTLREDVPQETLETETALYDEVGAATARLAALSGKDEPAARLELKLAEARLQRFKLELRQASPVYSRAVHLEPSSLAEIRRALAPDETLLNYHVGERLAFLWIVSRESASFHRLGSPREIQEAVDDFLNEGSRATLTFDGRLAGEEESRRLAELILPELPPAGRRLLIAADGPLHHLPFDALRHEGRYLVEDYETLVIPSATSFRIMREHPRRVSPGSFLGIGDPRGDDPDFPPLPFSGQALERIAELFPEGQRTVLTGGRATKTLLREQPLDRFRYVHFATHGWLDAESPRRCGLKLTPESDDGADGFLYLDEVFRLQLASELVVLSSCRSGLGELLRGEGLVSLTRAFLYAGARSLIVTLWDVDDRSTAEFMERFYKELTDGRSPPEALQAAKISFVRSERPRQRQPYHWAPFVLVGDPGGD